MPTALQKRPALRTPVFCVSVVRCAGPRNAAQTVTIDSSTPGRVFVGSSEATTLRVLDPLVSRRHLALEIRGDRLALQDLGSTNGTIVNGVTVTEALLRGGEEISIGESMLRVELVDANATVLVSPDVAFGRALGGSPEMRRLYPLFEKLARSAVPVIVEGETGTGKEVLAESIHEASPRRDGPFVIFDCTTVPANLAESALFGHEKGAFTGATSSRPGVFEQADGGTLFIDEIGDLDIELQPKLLRAIERSSVQRVGGTTWVRFDVRVIAATRRDLESAITAGRFRDDLYYRLAVTRVELPPLRKRAGDIALLAEHFWKREGAAGAPPAELLDALARYHWPGNVRELQNAIAHRVALGELADLESIRRATPGDGGSVEAPGERDVVARMIAERAPYTRARQAVLEDFERRYLSWVLAAHGGNVSKAAESCGIARRYFYILRDRSEKRGPT